jgi:type II secretory pathway pseudopilin PulG
MISRFHFAFSLVEVLAAVALIGIITFLALPNIVRIKQDSEENLAISRAEAINLTMASYVQAHGQTSAADDWARVTSADDRYTLLAPYLAYAPSVFSDYMPSGYSITLPSTLLPLSKVALTGPGGARSCFSRNLTDDGSTEPETDKPKRHRGNFLTMTVLNTKWCSEDSRDRFLYDDLWYKLVTKFGEEVVIQQVKYFVATTMYQMSDGSWIANEDNGIKNRFLYISKALWHNCQTYVKSHKS